MKHSEDICAAGPVSEPEKMSPELDTKLYTCTYAALACARITAREPRLIDWMDAHDLHWLTVCPECEQCSFEHAPDCQMKRGMDHLLAAFSNHQEQIMQQTKDSLHKDKRKQ